jgi:hypothetical protein
MGFFTSASEICLVVTNNNHEETTIEHLFIDYIVVCCYSWTFQPFMTIIRQTIFILYFKLLRVMNVVSFFWVIPRHLNSMCQRFGTQCPIFIGCVNKIYEDGMECSETSAHKIQTPGICPKEKIQHSEHSESLKS